MTRLKEAKLQQKEAGKEKLEEVTADSEKLSGPSPALTRLKQRHCEAQTRPRRYHTTSRRRPPRCWWRAALLHGPGAPSGLQEPHAPVPALTSWSGATPAAHLPLRVTPQCLSHAFACPWGHPHLAHITLKSAGQAARCPFSAPRRSGPRIVRAAVVCTGPFPLLSLVQGVTPYTTLPKFFP